MAKAPPKLSDPGSRPSLKWIALDQLVVDQNYQRQVKKDGRAGINRIAREFNWRKFQPLVVAPVNKDRYAVIDGQHRLGGARMRPDIPELPCYVVDAPDIAAQAGAFVALNSDRIGVSRVDRFWASVASGDAIARRIKAVCDKAGVRIARTQTSAQLLAPRETASTATLEKLLLFGDRFLVEGLKLLAEAQPTASGAFTSAAMSASVRLLALHDPRVDRARLVQALKGLDLVDEIAKAKAYRAVARGTLEDALLLIFIKAYNRVGSGGRLPETLQASVTKAAA